MEKTYKESSHQITIYRPNQRHDFGFFETWVVMAKNIAKSRELIWQLFKRDFFASYKKSFIGITWIFVAPIMGIVSWVFLNMTGMHLANPVVDYLPLGKNYGNSGGLFRGLRYALNKKIGWFWVMDDDANPDAYALQKILEHDVLQKNVYGSAAVGSIKDKKKLCFPAKTVNRRENKYIEYHGELNDVEEVAWVPFLGFFIHTEMIRRIGFPDPNFFILNDDVEYSERAKKHGAKIYMIKSSIIYHPYQQTIPINVFGRKVYYRSLPPWKVYFDVRNKIIIAKRYYPSLLFLQTLPGVLLRGFYSIFHEGNRWEYVKAYMNGIVSGLLNTTDRQYRPPVNA